jgi:urease accessory protein
MLEALLFLRPPVTLVFTQRLHHPPQIAPHSLLSLTAEERTKSRYHCTTDDGQAISVQLPRGTTLRDGDWLLADEGELIHVRAKPEPVLTVTCTFPLALLQAAYHLGNRHVPLEITVSYLRFSPDPVLQKMLEQRGLEITEEVVAFQPELGAYGGHSH